MERARGLIHARRPAIETIKLSIDRLAPLFLLCLVSFSVLDQASWLHATTPEQPHPSPPQAESIDQSANERETAVAESATREADRANDAATRQAEDSQQNNFDPGNNNDSDPGDSGIFSDDPGDSNALGD